MRIKGLAYFVTVLAALTGCASEPPPAPPPPPVTVATPLQRQVIDWDDYVGRFVAIDTVDVKPRATGYVLRVHFTDGDYVRAGQLLFTIDPRPAQAQLDQARAQVVSAEASLVNARQELARSRTLAEARAAPIEEVEQRQANVRTAEAALNAARANVRANALNLGFTRVLAPISGRISQRLVDPGNSVTADTTVLTTIVSTDPVHFTFDSSEALLLRYLNQGNGGLGSPVLIRLQDEGTYSRPGRIDFIDNALDTGAGTITMRAIVPNPDGFLKPGMFGYLRLSATQPYNALLIPDTAIGTDGARRIVYLVARDGTVSTRPVQLGPLLSGGVRVIRSGLNANDRIVIDGLQRAIPGQKVTPRAGRIQPPPDTQPTVETPAPTPPAAATPVAAR